MTKKYELTKNTEEYFGKTLYQIKALIEFEGVIKGEIYRLSISSKS